MDSFIFVVRLVLTALLYAFLVAVLVVLWRDLQADTAAQAVVQERKARLVVLAGADSLQVDQCFTLQPFTVLGRNAANTIVLPDAFASAEHAIVSWRSGQWWLEDMGSRNGTRLNDEAIMAPTVLSAGDVISIGQVKLKVEIEA